MNPIWTDLTNRAGLTLQSQTEQRLAAFLDLLLDANRRMNLTRITDPAEAELHHVADALTLLPYLPAGPIELADVGSGGGVPGVPLAIVRPDLSVTLIESTRKKAAFLRDVARQLQLSNVTVLDDRAEAIAHSRRRESFDLVTARAVAALVWLAEWCLPLCKAGGKVLAMKGARIADELPEASRAIRLLGGGEPIVHPVELPGTQHHVIVEIAKRTRSDVKYPRDPTIARGKPLAR